MKIIYKLLLLILIPASIHAQTKIHQQPQPLVFIHVTVIDMTGAKPKPDMTVVISGNKISDMGKTGKINIPENAQIINAAGKYLIPGLWDMHVHLFNNISGTGTNNKDHYFPLFIANGITGVRDMWTDPDDIQLTRQWQKEIENGEILGPRMAVGSRIVDGIPTFLPNLLGVNTAEDARKAVRTLKDSGAGFIKVYWNLSPEAYYAIADESKKLNIDFAGHVPFSINAADASDAGQKSIEHFTGILEACSGKEDELRKKEWSTEVEEEYRTTFDEQKCIELFKRFAKNQTWNTPTAVLHRGISLYDVENFQKDLSFRYVSKATMESWNNSPQINKTPDLVTRKQRFERLLKSIDAMQQNGVPLLAGTDVGNPFVVAGFALHDELELFVQAGLTPMEALQSATINPAKYLNTADSLGTIEKGKIADLVLLDANPLDNIQNTKRIAAVVVNGRYISKIAREKMLSGVEDAVRNK